jgi:hypothetical protein
MAYTLHCPKLTLQKLLTIIQHESYIENDQGAYVLTLYWRVPEHMKDDNDMFGVEIRVKSKGNYLTRQKYIEYGQYGTPIELDIDECSIDCINGQELLMEKLKAAGLHCYTTEKE